MQNIAERYTGASVRRSEDPRILTGTGRYIDDVRLPGMLHAAFVRSPFAHARITSVDVSAAREAPGVVLVLTGEELEQMVVPSPGIAGMMAPDLPNPKYTTLATDKVRLVGDPVVLVVAESPNPSEGEIREALSGTICRCTGYETIVNGALRAAGVTGSPA